MHHTKTRLQRRHLTLAGSFLLTALLISTFSISVHSAPVDRALGLSTKLASSPSKAALDDKAKSFERGKLEENDGDSGLGTRKGDDLCPIQHPDLTALVPTYKTSTGKVTGDVTLEERPTLWLYVPYALTANRPGRLELLGKDRAGTPSYQTVATVTGTSAGVVGVRLPANTQLKENEQYKWRFTIVCKAGDEAENPFTEAIVSRLPKNPTLDKQLKNKSPLEKADIYAQNGIWYEALTTLAEQRRAKPGDAKISAKWRELLRQGGLSVFDAKPPGQQAP